MVIVVVEDVVVGEGCKLKATAPQQNIPRTQPLHEGPPLSLPGTVVLNRKSKSGDAICSRRLGRRIQETRCKNAGPGAGEDNMKGGSQEGTI